SVADRRTASNEWAADLGEELRSRARMKVRARQRAETAKARGVDVQLARGSCLTRPYAVATVTVPKTVRVAEYGRRLDAAGRRAGYAPLRLDLAHDVAFAASTVPLGVSLTRKATR
ncbi:SCO6880 family protein, partial [Leclercia adecarboxylata]|uniref:SCO6880 family protein n=1 Tax=Leclercia adecarboxylata TaxID=83655 RepID=UPI00234D0852